jgi:hypothetical protein
LPRQSALYTVGLVSVVEATGPLPDYNERISLRKRDNGNAAADELGITYNDGGLLVNGRTFRTLL